MENAISPGAVSEECEDVVTTVREEPNGGYAVTVGRGSSHTPEQGYGNRLLRYQGQITLLWLNAIRMEGYGELQVAMPMVQLWSVFTHSGDALFSTQRSG